MLSADGFATRNIRRIFEHWDRLRGERIAPARREWDPVDFPYALADMVLAAVERDGKRLRFRYRLVGHNLVQRDGYNMRGRYLDELPETEYQARIREAWTEVVHTRLPRCGVKEIIDDRRTRRFESLVLPLSSDGAAVDFIVGVQIYLRR